MTSYEWVVTLIHDNGSVDVRVSAPTPTEAAEQACKIEGAPQDAVMSVYKVKTLLGN